MIIEYIYQCVIAFLACYVFCYILSIKDKKTAFIASLGSALGWMMYLIAGSFVGVIGRNLIAAVTVALYAEFVARKIKTPSTILLIVGILPLVPGGGIYYTMEHLVQGNNQMFINKGLETFGVAGAIAVGVSTASGFYRLYAYIINKRRKKGEV